MDGGVLFGPMDIISGTASRAKLSPIRTDLKIIKGEPTDNGSPTYKIYDPIKNKYFNIGWKEFEIISRWGLGSAMRISSAINSDTTLAVSVEDVLGMSNFMRINMLLKCTSRDETKFLEAMAARGDLSLAKKFLMNYLFFRVPLFKPDNFLNALMPFVAPLFSKTAFYILSILCFVGMYLVSRNWVSFSNTFSYFFTFDGLLYFFFALAFTKLSHELGHAFCAKKYGCKIPTMGVAFIVMCPVLYTDTTDSWRLADRKKRIKVGLAGMAVELAIAVLATLLWSFLDEGPFRSAIFMLASVTWIGTLAINTSPFMRFDGYYLLSDILGVENLQTRAFAMARWFLRKIMLGVKQPPPEFFAKGKRAIIIIYAFATMIYRFTLFMGIALTVYHFVFKILGIMMMSVEVGFFLAMPIVKEIIYWWQIKKFVGFNMNVKITFSLLFLFLVWFIAPISRDVKAPAIISSQSYARVYLPEPAQFKQIMVQNGQKVNEGDVVAIAYSPDLEFELSASEKRIKALEWDLDHISARKEMLEHKMVMIEQLAVEKKRYESLAQDMEQLTLKAPFGGIVRELEDVTLGEYYQRGMVLLSILREGDEYIDAYVREKDIPKIKVGSIGYFTPKAHGIIKNLEVKVVHIDNMATKALPYPYMASLHKGDIPVKKDAVTGALVPHNAIYNVKLKITDEYKKPKNVVLGTVRISTKPVSLAKELIKSIYAVFIRESGF